MRTTFASAIALLVAAAAPSSANAADVYSSAKDPVVYSNSGPVNWTGFYLGLNGGYGEYMTSRDAILRGDIAFEDITATGTAHVPGAQPSGFLFGGQIGYLYQPSGSNFVFGGEFAFNGSNITGDRSGQSDVAITITSPEGSESGTFGPINTSMHQELDYVGALTGVAGLTLGNAMVYAKAGLAFGKVQETVGVGEVGMTSNLFVLSRSAVDTGWTAGAGIAYKFTPNWSFGLEFDYYDLGSHSINYTDTMLIGSPSSPLRLTTNSIAEDFWAVKGIVNYQVGGSVYQSLK